MGLCGAGLLHAFLAMYDDQLSTQRLRPPLVVVTI